MGDGDDTGCQQPIAIFASLDDAQAFMDWQKSLPDDQQRGELFAHDMRFVEGEFWNWLSPTQWHAPRVPIES